MSKNIRTIGVYGLGVMGRNLALNLEENGYEVSVYNRKSGGEENVVNEFLGDNKSHIKLKGFDSLTDFTASLDHPRVILIMVKAGAPVDSVIEELKPLLDQGDVIIDGGNSNFEDTERRDNALRQSGIRFVGLGVSGGEEGARHGASLMPGGNREAWEIIRQPLESIAATSFDGQPCCRWIGQGGAGHFVKMVHNGIEYADMQLLAESYDLLRKLLRLDTDDIADRFKEWNETDLGSYLMEISSQILRVRDADGKPLVHKIADRASQKGTGKWTALTALSHDTALPGITQAVYARILSSMSGIREKISVPKQRNNRSVLQPDHIKEALLGGRMAAYAEGFFLIKTVAAKRGWNIDLAPVAAIWQGGCIIRSVLLKLIEKIYSESPGTEHLFLSPDFAGRLNKNEAAWRITVTEAVQNSIPVPCFSAYLNLYDTLASETLPANLIQAQRDYFGAHRYERIDRPAGKLFHTEWP